MRQRASEGQSAERVGLAVGEALRAVGAPVTFSTEEMQELPVKAQEFLKARLLVWFEAQSYTPNARAYAKRKASFPVQMLPAVPLETAPSKFIGPATKPLILGKAVELPKQKPAKAISPKVEMRNECPRMVVFPNPWSK